MGFNKNNRPRKYRGTQYRSEFEIEVRKGLSRLKRKLRTKIKITYEDETLGYVVEKNYTPDFKIEREDGSVIYIEAKGYFDREMRQKMACVIEQHPDLEIVILFSSDNKVSKNSKTRYSDWCKQRGIDYAINEIPERWLVSDGE